MFRDGAQSGTRDRGLDLGALVCSLPRIYVNHNFLELDDDDDDDDDCDPRWRTLALPCAARDGYSSISNDRALVFRLPRTIAAVREVAATDFASECLMAA